MLIKSAYVDQAPTCVIDTGFGTWHVNIKYKGEPLCREDAPTHIILASDAEVWANRHIKKAYKDMDKLLAGITFEIERW